MAEMFANHVANLTPRRFLPGRERNVCAHREAPPAPQCAPTSPEDRDEPSSARQVPPRWPRVFPGL